MAKYVGALDQGTTSTRFILFTHDGAIAASHQLEHKQIYPRAGWVEHDPLEIWARVQDVIRGALEKANASAQDLAAIGITNQRETTVVWNKQTGIPYHNAIVWQDTRTDKLIQDLGQGDMGRFRAKTGLPLATYFSGPKLRWLLDNVEGLREAAEHGDALFGTIDTWVTWNLTNGAHVTDVSNASRTLLMNLETLDWDEELLREIGILRQMLPTIRPSSDSNLYGYTSPDGAVGGRVPVTGILGDQQAALFGQACTQVGEAKNTYGTGCFMLLNTGERIVPSKHGLLTTVGYKLGEQAAVYALEGSIAISGALITWLRDNLGLISKSAEVETLAQTVDDNGGVYFVPAFSGLFAPYWRSDARGVIVGMTGYSNKGHIARAALEATAYQTREVLEAMRNDSGVTLTTLKVDGGMIANNLLMQFQADILNVPVVRPKVAETTALGAAYAAGLAVGFWAGEAEMRANWGKDTEWTPNMPEARRESLFSDWKRAVERTFNWM